ncbi:MAG: hypothetical protein QXP68_00895 [Thermosphaera sp.]
MKIKGIHYGLTLLYSYLLPFFDIRETRYGFEFVKRYGSLQGIKCQFNEDDLLTQCEIPPNIGIGTEVLNDALGLSMKKPFEQLCYMADLYEGECLANQLTLMFNPLDARDVLKVIVLSRNTDYYYNTVRWARQIFSGKMSPEDFSSYIPKTLSHLNGNLDRLSFNAPTPRLIRGLLSIESIGPKTVSALLLHGYGKTRYAPIDRHFEKMLSNLLKVRQPSKKYCIENSLRCEKCSISAKCKYGVSLKLFGEYNGIIQSMSYVAARLKTRRSPLEKTLVKNVKDFKSIDRFLSILVKKFTGRACERD